MNKRDYTYILPIKNQKQNELNMQMTIIHLKIYMELNKNKNREIQLHPQIKEAII